MSSRKKSRRCNCPKQELSLGQKLGGYAETAGRLAYAYWTGGGDYTLKSNSLVTGGGATSSNVQILPGGPRETRIIYREYLGDVYTHPTVAGAFNIAGYSLNPGLLATCPWLAPIAQQYEQWTPNGIVFEFRSTSSEYVSTQALGSVVMATEYDSLDTAFTNKQEMLNAAYSNEAKPSERIVHGVECDPRDNPNRIFYVRAGPVPSGGSVRDYDLGTFYVATQGGATANLNLGSLYIHYDITLRKEQLFNGLTARGTLYALYTNSVSYTNANPLTNFVYRSGYNNLVTLTGTTITFPTYTTGARWAVMIRWYGSVAAAYAFSALLVGLQEATGTSASEFWSGGTSSYCVYAYIFTQTARTASIAFSGMTLPTGTQTASMYITQISSDVSTLN